MNLHAKTQCFPPELYLQGSGREGCCVLVGIGCHLAAGNHLCQDLLDSIALRPRARAVCSSLRFRDCHYSYSGSVLGENKWL